MHGCLPLVDLIFLILRPEHHPLLLQVMLMVWRMMGPLALQIALLLLIVMEADGIPVSSPIESTTKCGDPRHAKGQTILS